MRLKSDGCELWDRFNLTHSRATVAFCELGINDEGMKSTVLKQHSGLSA